MIDAATIRGIIFRQRWLIAGVLATSVIIGILITLLATPMYQAQSSVRIEPYGNFIIEGQDVQTGIASNQVWDLLQTQMGIIESRSLARTVAEDLNLGERTDFFGEEFEESRPANVTDERWREVKLEAAAEELQSSVTAESSGENWIIQIGYSSEDPAFAAEVANAYAAAFAASETRQNLKNNAYAREYLSEQIAITRARLQEAEQAANDYARSNQIIAQSGGGVDGMGSSTVTASNMSAISQQVTAAQAARIDAEQRWRSIQNLPAGQLADAQNNALLQGLIQQRTEKQNELASLRQRLLDAHPSVIDAQEQLANLDAQINRTAADIKARFRNDYTIARNQENALRGALSAATNETLGEQDLQVEYSVLERETQAVRAQLDALLNRFNQISTATEAPTGMINPLDSAVVPTSPYAPSLLINLQLALVLGAAVAAVLAFLRETLDDKVRSFDEVENKIGLKLLGHTPFVEEHDIEADGSDRFSPLMEAYASIRSAIDFAVPGEHRVLQLTSSQASEGKSTTALILAELFASVGRRVLLVDGDLRRPALGKLLSLERSKKGFVEVLLGKTDLQSALVRGGHDNLAILPVGEVPDNPSEIFASAQFREFVAMARQEYELVIFDSCPMLGLADAPLLASQMDGTIFVMEANNVQFSQVRASIKRLQNSGGRPIGAILTKYKALTAGESYSYQYGYYQYR